MICYKITKMSYLLKIYLKILMYINVSVLNKKNLIDKLWISNKRFVYTLMLDLYIMKHS